jgi:hypothetical protein
VTFEGSEVTLTRFVRLKSVHLERGRGAQLGRPAVRNGPRVETSQLLFVGSSTRVPK